MLYMIFYNEKQQNNNKIIFNQRKETNCSEEELLKLNEYITKVQQQINNKANFEHQNIDIIKCVKFLLDFA